MNKRRWVVDGRFLAAPVTGLHRVARSLLAAALEAGWEAEVWAPSATSDPLVSRRFPALGGRVGGRLWEQVILPAAAGNREIVSLTNTAPLARPGVLLVHDLAAAVGPQWFARSMRWYAATVQAAARRARLVVTVSHAVRDELVAMGVGAEHVAVVPPAVDPVFRPAEAEAVAGARERWQLSRPYALVIGWADPRKDLATAVAAHRAVYETSPHDLVLVGGSHPTFAAVAPPTGPTVRQLGRVGDGDLVALLSGAAVLLYPSRYEGFGLPPLEALACGTPAVASDIPALRESTAGRVRLVPPSDVAAWSAALADGLRGELSCPSAPERTWQQVGRQWVAALADAPEQ